MDAFLSGYEGKTIAQFEIEIMELGNDGLFKALLATGCFTLQTKKFKHHGILDDFFGLFRMFFFFGNSQHMGLVLA